jgi:hypothetical protein
MKMTTLIYEYGARLDAECIPAVNEQFWLAHQLYNNIVAVIKDTQRAAHELLLSRCPAAQIHQRALDDAEEAFKAARAVEDAEGMKQAKAAKREHSKAMWDALKEVRKTCKDELAEIYGRIGMRSTCATYQCIKPATDAGLGRQTADMIHDTALKAWQKVRAGGGEIRFRKMADRQSDHIDVRFTAAGGIPADELLSGRHRMISMGETGMEAPSFGAARGRYFPGFKFRIGAAKAEQYATGTWQYHRPIPEGARVTTVRLIRKRIGPDTRWALQLQMSVPEAPKLDVPAGRKPFAAAHFGWSLSDEGLRRICAITDEVDSGLAQFVDLPYDINEDLRRANLLQQERDDNRDKFVADILKGDVRTAGWLDTDLEELAALRRLPAQHVAAKRLSRLSWSLEHAGNEWPELKAFAIQDRWLYQAQRHIETRTRNRRKNFYRHVALDWVRKYEVILVATPDLKEAAKRRKDDGERSDLGQIARTARSQAALYEFKQALEWAATRAGSTVLYADDLSHARICACCGEPVERETDIVTCAACGHSDDVKANAAARLWQQEQGRYAEAAAQAQQAIREAREAAALKQREKLARMAEKRVSMNPVSDGVAELGAAPEAA